MGNSRPTEWSSAYFYKPQIPAILENRGEIFAVISLSSPASFDSVTAGNLLLDQLHEQYFESTDDSVLLSLEKSVLKVKKRLLELLENDEESSAEGIDLDLITCVVKEGMAFIVRMGDSKIFAFRDGTTVDFSEGLRDPDGKGELKVGSVKLQDGDKFGLLTPQMVEELNEGDESTLLNQFNLNTVESKNLSNEALASLVLFSIGGVDDEESVKSSDEAKEEPASVSLSSRRKTQPAKKKDTGGFEKNVLADHGDTMAKQKLHEAKQLLEKGAKSIDKNVVANIREKLDNIKYDRHAKTFKVVGAKVFSAVFNIFVNIYSFIKEDLLNVGGNRMYTRGKQPAFNWRPLVFFGVIIFISIYFVVSSVRKNIEDNEVRQANSEVLESVTAELSNLEERVGGLVTKYDKVDEKNQTLESVLGLQTQLESVTAEEFLDQKDEQINKINVLENNLKRRIVLTEPNIIRDFGVLEGANPVDIDASPSQVFVSDDGIGTVYAMDYGGENSGRVIEGVENVSSIAYSPAGELVFLDTSNPNRVLGFFQPFTGVTDRYAGTNTTNLGDVGEIDAPQLAEGDFRIYGARTNTKEVIQMKRGTTGYGLPDLRMANRGFGNLLDIEINNRRIYLLSEGQGQGLRVFFGDNEIPIEARGIVSGETWYTADSLEVDNRYIYVGDSQNKRILVFTKARSNNENIIDYVAQIDLSSLQEGGAIKDMAGTPDGSYLFILANTKIIRFDLSELAEFDY